MKGDKKTIIAKPYFYKEYSEKEYTFLKALHEDNLFISRETIEGIEYIKMPFGYVISIDTIKADKRNSDSIKHIINSNIPFMLEQVNRLNELSIYYTDCMQWLYLNDKLYLIDMDFSFTETIDYNHNNYSLLNNFLSAFNVNSSYISESLRMLDLFQCEGCSLIKSETELYNKLHNDNMKYNHVYYCRNQRHIMLKTEYVHIYGNTGNIVITDNLLSDNIINEWELIKIA